MKKIILFLLCTLFFNCNSTKKANSSEALDETTTKCPDDGECNTVIHKDKQLIVKVDEIGSKYFQLLDNEGTSVVVFQYRKTVDESLQDGNYMEEVIFELQNNVTSLDLLDIELQSTKMLYGRHCYCKGQTGYFDVMKGNLILSKTDHKIKFKLDFKIDEVPQLIASISETIE